MVTVATLHAIGAPRPPALFTVENSGTREDCPSTQCLVDGAPEVLMHLRRVGTIKHALGKQHCSQRLGGLTESRSPKPTVPTVGAARNAVRIVANNDTHPVSPPPARTQDHFAVRHLGRR